MGFAWPVWIALGLVLMGVEIIIPGFVIFWFGVGGLITGLLCWAGIIKTPFWQWIVFFGSSLAFLAAWFLFFKRFFQKIDPSDVRDPTLLDLRGKVTSKIEPGKPGKVKLYDAYHGLKEWKAESNETILEDEEISVLESSGINLVVRKQNPENSGK